MEDFEHSSHKPLREQVYDQLKRRILTGKIKPGTRMMEIDLAEDLGVSRTPVREAIRELGKEGLVTIEPRRGAFASEISVKDMIDTLAVREDLDALAAYLASSRITKAEEKKLLELTDKYAAAIESGDMDTMIRADEAFHKRVARLSGNKTLYSVVRTVQTQVLRFRYLYYEDLANYKNMPAEHREIIEALVSGDSEHAREVAFNHVRRLKDFVIKEGPAFAIYKDGTSQNVQD